LFTFGHYLEAVAQRKAMARAYDVYGVGHALVDLQYRVAPDFLARLGIAKGVMTLVDQERQQAIIDALDSNPVASASGGSAANTLIGVARFGGRACYACLIGRDGWGDFYQQDLERAGVASHPANRVDGRTGQCLVLITPDADRTLNTCLGVSSAMGPSQLQEAAIAASHYLYLEGYLLSADSGFAACLAALDLARRHRTAISLTLSDPFMVSAFRGRFARLLEEGIDLLFCNEEEARAYTGENQRQAAARALGEHVPTACVTCGAQGAIIYAHGRPLALPGVLVQAIDTTGAGDLFAGGVLFGLTHGFSLEEAGRLGSYAAAQVVARYGPRLDQDLSDTRAILAHFSPSPGGTTR
jgi:sugar/nucleoside kinase (ribokinase family)